MCFTIQATKIVLTSFLVILAIKRTSLVVSPDRNIVKPWPMNKFDIQLVLFCNCGARIAAQTLLNLFLKITNTTFAMAIEISSRNDSSM